MTTARRLDTTDLEERVKDMYREVAEEPHKDFHFETGRPLAERLGYPPADLDRIPAAAIDSFAGVGYYFDLAAIARRRVRPRPGKRLGHRQLRRRPPRRPGGPRDRRRHDRRPARQGERPRPRRRASPGSSSERATSRARRSRPARWTASSATASSTCRPTSRRVFAQAARALRPGGRLALADIVTEVQLPEGITCDAALWAACIGGAMQRDRYREAIEAAGFKLLEVRENTGYRFISDRAAGASDKYGVTSISLLAERR